MSIRHEHQASAWFGIEMLQLNELEEGQKPTLQATVTLIKAEEVT
jgi:hypothetical protein